MTQYFPKLFEPFGGYINVKVDLPNYTTKADLKNPTRIDTSKLASKSNLASLKTEVDKVDIDIDKLIPVPADLSRLSDVVKNDVVKVNNIDSSVFVLKTKYVTDKSYLEMKISDAGKKFPEPIVLSKKNRL